MNIALLCGGPSLERGISLNSARSVVDHLASERVHITPIYFDVTKHAYRISTADLYSSTPCDFDFKLDHMAKALSKRKLVSVLRRCDIVFPLMHGPFGEDGGIQSFLERQRIPFIGSGSAACKRAFDKFTANKFINVHGFFTLPSMLLKIYHSDHRDLIGDFFKEYGIRRAVVKPASGGSSIGVFSVATPDEALEKARILFSKRIDTRVVIEPFATGTEFTLIILQNRFGLPVALPPTEIETDYTRHQIFDYRRKYLPTHQVVWHCPPRFDDGVIEKIQAQAEQLFALFDMRDFARFDGWVLPDGKIWFCDFNLVSGMEQNSFLFQQSSRIGLTHSEVLHFILDNACRRYGITLPEKDSKKNHQTRRKPVHVLFGGATSERQVSLMSGTNVWLKLRSSRKYKPLPFLLDTDDKVWHIPYHLALNHTVEEISENCRLYQVAKEKLELFEKRARIKLGLGADKDAREFFEPYKISLTSFVRDAPFIFNALHGGFGEDGGLQSMMDRAGTPFNGPDAQVSRLCMDKWNTSRCVRNARITGVNAAPGMLLETKSLVEMNDSLLRRMWMKWRKELGARTLIIKPRADGCSTGVAHLYTSTDFIAYQGAIKSKIRTIPAHTFTHQSNIIEMPPQLPSELVLEAFIETDVLEVHNKKLTLKRKAGWIEVTVGVVEVKRKLKVLSPSITVTAGDVLTVEEKFQGGTGINITPPPPDIIKPNILNRIKERILKVSEKLGINGYSRIDAFVQRQTGDVLIIEVNTLPALTPSTVLYHQALAEHPQIFPREFIELLIDGRRS